MGHQMTGPNAGEDGKRFLSTLNPIKILNAAQRAVPVVKFGLGVAGVAAAGSLVIGLLGYGRVTVLTLGGMFVAMVLLFLFSKMVGAKDRTTQILGQVLATAVTIFVCAFLLFTITAFATRWPEPWVQFLGISGVQDSKTSKFVRFFGPLSHLEEAIKISEATFGLSISGDQISNFYASEMRAPTWNEWFYKFCASNLCLKCEPEPTQIKSNLQISLVGKLRGTKIDGSDYVVCE